MERYERLRVIGQGAFGKVFLVRRLTDSMQVVIKQIPVDDLGAEERFAALNEVKVLSMLKHPNIVAYYDNFVHEKSLMIVMEYAPGATLHEFIQERNKVLLDEDHILLFFVQLLVAIEHVHLLNILHRDLKTQNVMMNRKRNILKIGDFGISKVLSSKITSAQTVVGTPCYISPEICEGKMYATKSDMWALGCILYELTTLRKAFEGPNLPALVLKIMQASAALEPMDPGYSGALKDLIYCLLQRNPDDRPDVHRVMATPLLVNAHMNLATDVGRMPCTRLNPATNSPITCTRMNSKGNLCQRSYVVEEYMSPGGPVSTKTPRPVVFLWGGNVSVPLKVEPPPELSESKMAAVACGRTQKSGVTDDGKLIFWEVSLATMPTSRQSTIVGGGSPAPSIGTRGKGRRKEPVQYVPRVIGGLKTTVIRKVACGDMFTACLTDKGILMTFGSGANGSLGHGDNSDVKEPKLVQAMLEFETTEVSCGSYHVIAITSEGSVYSWGRGDRGQLGLGSCDHHHTPQRVWMPASAASSVPVMATCGSDCSVIITNSGQVFATGTNRDNKLMLDKKPTAESAEGNKESGAGTKKETADEDDGTPAILKLFKDQSKMTQSLYIASMKRGGNKGRGIGSTMGGPMSSTVLRPSASSGSAGISRKRVAKPKWMVSETSLFTLTGSESVKERNIISASLGTNHIALLTASGEVLTCGNNTCGQLGYRKAPPPADANSPPPERTPQVVTALVGKEMVKVSCGDFFTIACCKDGGIYSWGKGRLGTEQEENQYEPQVLPFEFPSHQVQGLSSRYGVTMLITVPQQ